MINYLQRQQHVRNVMRREGVDLLVFTPGAAMRYLTGFTEHGHERLLALFFSVTAPPLFVTPALNASQVASNPAEIKDIRVWDDGDDWTEIVNQVGQELRETTILVGLDDDMPARFALPLQTLLPAVRYVTTSKLLSELRCIKDEEEVNCLRSAAQITDQCVIEGIHLCKPGNSEMDIAMAIQCAFAKAGAEPAFDPIIAAGHNAAMPHHHTSTAKLQQGDIVVLDVGAKLNGYCGDITRVVAVQQSTELARHVYSIVYAAHQCGLEAIRPGATAEDVDNAVRHVIVNAGYGEFFMHRTGHGIGLDEHESPYIVAGNKDPLLPGHCFSIEPGIYLPGQFGIRLENIVTVAEDFSPLVLNAPIPPELPIVN